MVYQVEIGDSGLLVFLNRKSIHKKTKYDLVYQWITAAIRLALKEKKNELFH